MLLKSTIESKSTGSELLLAGLSLQIEENEKVGLIGRNGVGKTTFFNMLSGQDNEYDGEVEIKRGTVIISTAQEHHDVKDQTAVDYIVASLSEYTGLKHIIDTYPAKMGHNMRLIHNYSEALERFGQLGYYEIENEILRSLQSYQVSETLSLGKMSKLSGGQKRLVELTKVQLSRPDLALIDEPTNHMDYIAKAAFIDWLKAAKHACLIITHDRDVLNNVERIIEIKDKKAFSYKGDYDAYLAQNSQNTANQMQGFEIAQKTIANLQKQIEFARARSAKGGPRWVTLRERYEKELAALQATEQKPSFWIDQESVATMNPKLSEKYDKYKAKNIRIGKTADKERSSSLVKLNDVRLGYDGSTLFRPVKFELFHGDRLHLVGRNGAGKTTLIKAILAASQDQPVATLLGGEITVGKELRLSLYEQEITGDILELKLADAIEQVYRQQNLPITAQQVMRTMGDYLFEPAVDGQKPVANLSGGQKARLQLIKMLAGNPNLLILDEPTNHLDLPSIEELEHSLKNYHGALLYVSHDSYFSKNIGGKSLTLTV